MNLFGLTDIGSVRSENQDSYTIRQFGEHEAVVVVCDGMGGAQAGNVASAVAVETFAAAVEDIYTQDAEWDQNTCIALLQEACSRANTQVYQLSRSDPQYRGMGTTLVAALLLGQDAYVINVGDSRCYLLDQEGIHQVSKDHSWVQFLVDRGDITPEEARVHPKKNLITKALGVDRDVRPDCFHIPLEENSRLLLCSDGLSNVLTDEELLRESGGEIPLDEGCRSMMALTLEQGAPDNVTIVMAQL